MPGHLVRRCHQISVSLFHDECANRNPTSIQFAVLRILAEYGAVHQITLAGYAALNRSATGEVVNRFEARGLVERREGTEDRRIKVVTLTEADRQLLEDVHEAVRRVQEHLPSPLPDSERARFLECLTRIATNNNEYSRAPLRRGGTARRTGDK